MMIFFFHYNHSFLIIMFSRTAQISNPGSELSSMKYSSLILTKGMKLFRQLIKRCIKQKTQGKPYCDVLRSHLEPTWMSCSKMM